MLLNALPSPISSSKMPSSLEGHQSLLKRCREWLKLRSNRKYKNRWRINKQRVLTFEEGKKRGISSQEMGDPNPKVSKIGVIRRKKPNLKCFYCHKKGHSKRECPDMKKRNNGKQRESEDSAEVADEYDSAEALVIYDGKSSKEWILDSSFTFHMCPNQSWFETLSFYNGRSLLLGNNKTFKVAGIGTAKLKLYDGFEKVMQQVRHIPELKRNLILLGMLESNRYWFKSKNFVTHACS